MGFSRQEYWSRLPFPSPGDLPDPRIRTCALTSLVLAGGFFRTSATWEGPPSIRPAIVNAWHSKCAQSICIPPHGSACPTHPPRSHPSLWSPGWDSQPTPQSALPSSCLCRADAQQGCAERCGSLLQRELRTLTAESCLAPSRLPGLESK